MKKVLIKIAFLSIICSVIFTTYKVKASENILVYVVTDKESYQKDEVFELSICIPRFTNLHGAIISFDNQNKIFTYSDNPFYLNSHSIFNKYIVNEANESKALFEVLQDLNSEGIYSSYKNNLCNILLTCNKDISNVDLLPLIKIYLFDENHNLISYSLEYAKRLQGKFSSDLITCEVFSSIDLKDYFEVSKDSDYELVTEKEVNPNILGNQICQIGLYDFITGDYSVYSTIFNIVDNEGPSLIFFDNYNIVDTTLDDVLTFCPVECFDNYDSNCNIFYEYYDKNYNKISDTCVKDVLIVDFICLVKVYATDLSGNKSEEVWINYHLIDTIKPSVFIDDVIYIKDIKIDSFNIGDYVTCVDNLCSDLELCFEIKNISINKIVSLNELNYFDDFIIYVYAVDSFGNQSNKVSQKLVLQDCKAPTIEIKKIEPLKDVMIDDFNLLDLVVVSDNFEVVKTEMYYYIKEESVSLNIFKDELKKGLTGSILYKAYDKDENMSELMLEISLIDTTPPNINCNVVDNKIYKDLKKITYEVSDNFNNLKEAIVLLDGNVYNNQLLTEGKHHLYIKAIDDSNNVSELEVNFVISEKGYLYNVVKGNVFIESNVILIIITCLMVILIIYNIVYKCIKSKSNHKTNKE